MVPCFRCKMPSEDVPCAVCGGYVCIQCSVMVLQERRAKNGWVVLFQGDVCKQCVPKLNRQLRKSRKERLATRTLAL